MYQDNYVEYFRLKNQEINKKIRYIKYIYNTFNFTLTFLDKLIRFALDWECSAGCDYQMDDDC